MNLSSRLVGVYQRAALVVGYAFFRLRRASLRRRAPITWVVGPDEMASMVAQIAGAVPGSYSVSFKEESAYTFRYDHRFRSRPQTARRRIERLIVGPWLLAELANRASGFIYVGSTGFLLESRDQREFEFRFLKRHGIPIVIYWCGSDIRSTRRMNELEAATGLPNISTYIGQTWSFLDSDAWDQLKREIAQVADRYAHAMYSNSVDHLGYLTTPTEPFLYFLPDEDFTDHNKFENLEPLVVVHATTSPVIKGTQLVRAAVARLKEEGYDFEYVELIGVPNSVVRAEIARAHIAMNQFYGFSPAVFGAEALAAGCVVMMSSDEHVETDLPPGTNEAWVVTKHHQVYDNLKQLLDDPARLPAIAERGIAWGRQYASRSGAGAILNRTLDAVLDGSYRPPGVSA